MRTVLDPVVEFLAASPQRVLNVYFFTLVAAEGEIEPMQRAGLERLLPFDLIQEIRAEMRIAEEQPVAAAGARCHRARFRAFLHEAAKWRNAGAGADHDHVARSVRRQTEALVRFDKDRHAGVVREVSEV